MTGLREPLLELLAPWQVRDLSEPHRLGGGSSQENWSFDAQFGDASTRRPLLLRREPERGVVETDRDVEFGLLKALGHSGLPVATVYAFDDGTLLGRRSMVVDRLPGRAHRGVLRDADPLGLGEAGRLDLARALPDLLARVHNVDVDKLGLDVVLPDPSGDPAAAELKRWEAELDAVELSPQPALRATVAWLRRNLPPPPERICLVHGDFRPANILVEDGRISALLDWELARLGDPHDDLGWYTCSIYRREHSVDARWGIAEFLDAWSAGAGQPVDPRRLHFWQVMSTFRLAVIALTGIKAFCDKATDRPAGPADRVIAAALRDTGLISSAAGQEISR
ncbi:phosphotransferase family protein [Mycolicibacterium neoaurum]|uniref:phosphotransferase family protein n=1 Tax=Mycolicibacterium neoaurum TaxID=1795 RepID=UPI00267403D0|nr:phosphotransferase family protein [Mycolicibacterium neoaurum]MDO3402753.1 phosphotransferase family protein [Mycolicibacterium neoaurum]